MTFVDAFQQVLLDRQKDNRMQTIGKAMEKPNAQGSFEHLHRMRKSFPRSLENQKFIEIPDNSSPESSLEMPCRSQRCHLTKSPSSESGNR